MFIGKEFSMHFSSYHICSLQFNANSNFGKSFDFHLDNMKKVTVKLSKRLISPARPFDNHKLRTRRRPSSARKKHVLNVEMGSALTKTQGFLNEWDKQIMRFNPTDRAEYVNG